MMYCRGRHLIWDSWWELPKKQWKSCQRNLWVWAASFQIGEPQDRWWGSRRITRSGSSGNCPFSVESGEIYVLLEKLTQLHEIVYGYESKLEHDDFIYFLKNQYARVRNTEEMTAREMIRNYITLLNLTQQNSDRPKEEILYAVEDYNVKSN